ncbi:MULTISPECIES: hypothetical protein [Clostridium]|uniref:hypothetical protein n=1 Tax=Clostridium TaxID=1485 RepID=UPI00090C7B62|nr:MULTISPECIES: hypothetical protein [Clostridium]APF25252.1 hypothetical protein NPD7_4049 [Clostridium sporogenes]MBD5640735.1 hypothetical protein [Clostridium botulinum]MDI6918899.1 hypothetical protein [Clostridium botulinum]WMU99579.1 hypothetical protein QA656_19815 [Clostridium botulinum]
MRWKENKILWMQRRIIKTFLIFPKTIGGETRWLEWVYIGQIYRNRWENVEWEDIWNYDKFIKNKLY